MGVGGPYDVAGRDGNTYFYKLDPSPSLVQIYVLLDRMASIYRQVAAEIPDPAQRLDAEAQAGAADLVLAAVSDGANAASVTAAAEAERAAQTVLAAKQLRPDPPGKSFGARLKDSISCRPIPGPSGLGTLEVGIGDEAELDQAVGDSDGQPYWKAQEFGSAHNVGRRIRGLYQPGGAAPDAGQFRLHPIFEVGGEGAVPMLIQNPIPAKSFLREAGIAAQRVRDQEFDLVSAAAKRELALITSGNHPAIRKVRRVIR